MVNTINVSGYGSLQNAMANQTRPLPPTVGMGVTEIMYSDRHPYTVTQILAPKRIKVRRDDVRRIDNRGASESQDYEYTPSDAPEITLRMNKRGQWKEEGHPTGSTYLVGRREEYYDFTR